MPDNVNALIVIFAIAGVVFLLAKQPVTAEFMSEESYKRRRNLWVATTLIVFFAGNFWLYCFLVFALVLATHKRDHNVMALYLTLLLAVPAISVDLPGFAGVETVFTINHIRILALALLLPTAITLYRARATRERRTQTIDFYFGCLVAWMTFRALIDLPLTQFARDTFTLFLDMVLPYYVASRFFQSTKQIREAAAAFVVVALIAGLVGMFETNMYWLLYYELYDSLNVPAGQASGYFVRDGLGALRAQGAMLQPIVYGYVLMIGAAFGAYFAPNMRPRWRYALAMLALLGGLFAGLSRGPWIGALAIGAVVVIFDPLPGRRFFRLIIGGFVGAVVLFLSPIGPMILDNLPFIGTVDRGTVDYRFRLFDISLEVISQNPWLGDRYYQLNPLMAELRQGQGIIDIVNTYLLIALPSGLIALAFFLMIFISAGLMLRKARKANLHTSEDDQRLGRFLFAILVGIMVTIATVSNIGVTAPLYWIIIGISAAYSSIMLASTSKAKEPQSRHGLTERMPGRSY